MPNVMVCGTSALKCEGPINAAFISDPFLFLLISDQGQFSLEMLHKLPCQWNTPWPKRSLFPYPSCFMFSVKCCPSVNALMYNGVMDLTTPLLPLLSSTLVSMRREFPYAALGICDISYKRDLCRRTNVDIINIILWPFKNKETIRKKKQFCYHWLLLQNRLKTHCQSVPFQLKSH